MIPDCLSCGQSVSICACFGCNCEGCVESGCRCRNYDREKREDGPIPSPPPVQLSEDQLDELVSQTSVPNLGALIRQGKKTGLIKPSPAY